MKEQIKKNNEEALKLSYFEHILKGRQRNCSPPKQPSLTNFRKAHGACYTATPGSGQQRIHIHPSPSCCRTPQPGLCSRAQPQHWGSNTKQHWKAFNKQSSALLHCGDEPSSPTWQNLDEKASMKVCWGVPEVFLPPQLLLYNQPGRRPLPKKIKRHCC